MAGDGEVGEASRDHELETKTMHVFISRALQKVLKEAPKKHTQLRQSCTEVLGAPLCRPPSALPRAPAAVPWQPR